MFFGAKPGMLSPEGRKGHSGMYYTFVVTVAAESQYRPFYNQLVLPRNSSPRLEVKASLVTVLTRLHMNSTNSEMKINIDEGQAILILCKL